MKWILIATSLIVSTLALGQVKDPVVAEVNGKIITKSQLSNYHQQNLSFVSSSKKVTVQDSLNDMVNKLLGVQKGKAGNLHKKQTIIDKMDDIIYHAQISKDLEPKLMEIKEVTDAEVKKYYKDNPEYRTAQILYRLRVNPSEDEVKKALELSLNIYKDVSKKPEDFISFAQKFSQSSSAYVGGDIGYQPKTRLSPEYYNAIKGKRVNFISKPFRSQYGLHIVKVLGVKSYEQIEKNLYKKIIYDIKRDEILNKYFKDLRAKAKSLKIYKDRINDI